MPNCWDGEMDLCIMSIRDILIINASKKPHWLEIRRLSSRMPTAWYCAGQSGAGRHAQGPNGSEVLLYYEGVNRNELTSVKVGANMCDKGFTFCTHPLWVTIDGPFGRVKAHSLKKSIFGDNEKRLRSWQDGLRNHQRGGRRSRHILCRQVHHTR